MTSELSESLEVQRAAANAARERALELLQLAEFDKALAAYDEALAHARAEGDGPFIDWMFACRAAAVVEVGPTDDVLVELKRILLRATDPQTAVRAAHTAASIYELKKDVEKALFYNKLAGQHAERTGDPVLRAHCANQLGSLLTTNSRFVEAGEAFAGALRDTEGIEAVSPVWRALWKDNLGYCLMVQDRVKEGLALAHEALDFLESRSATGHTVFPLLDLCFGYLKIDRFAEARYFGEEGLDRAHLAGDPTLEKNLLYLLGETCHLSGDVSGSQFYFDRLASLYPEFRNLRAYLEAFDFRNVLNLRA